MRTGLLALALLAAPAAAPAADPPVVFQTQPPGRLLDDARLTAKLLAGDEAAEALNKGLQDALGEKGFDGLDLFRPAGGYVLVPADPKQTVGVLALPATGEEAFVGFFERLGRGKQPKKLDGGLYELNRKDGVAAMLKVADGYAYIAVAADGVDLAKVLGADLVPFGKLVDPAETAQFAARVYFDRFPKEVRTQALGGLDEAKKALAEMKLPPEVGDAAKSAFDQLVKLSTRYLDLSKGAKEAGVRVNLDPATAGLKVDVVLSAQPGSQLAKDIAARKPTTNAFAGLLTPDAVTGFRTRLPLFTPEIREAAVVGLEAAKKEAGNSAPPFGKAVFDEFFDLAVRTAKTGEADFAGVVRGPDANGFYTGVVAAAADDPSGVEKELKKLIVGMAPPDFADLMKWDADKAGGVSIHVYELGKSNEVPARETRAIFGPDAVVAVAAAPKAVVAAVGPDAVAAVKAALELKPGPAPVLDAVVNPAKVAKMVGAMEPEAGAMVARSWGAGEKGLSVLFLDVAGGPELKVTFGINLKMLTGALLGARAGATFRPVDPPPVDKN